jgi:hypothetical protein
VLTLLCLGFITVKEQCDYCKDNDSDSCCKNLKTAACAAAANNPNMLTVTSSASSLPDQESSGLSSAAIAGIAAAGVFLLLFSGFLFFFYRSVKRSTNALLSSVQPPKPEEKHRGFSYRSSKLSHKPPIFLDTTSLPSPSVSSPLNRPSALISPPPMSATGFSTRSFYSDAITEPNSATPLDNEYLVIIAFGKLLCLKFVS